MRKGILIFMPAIICVLFMESATYGQLPADQMSYQGRLLSDGEPVPDDTYTIDFSIWDDATSGNMVWSEQQQVQTLGGLFQAKLGSVVPLEQDFFGGIGDPNSRWLQMQVAGDEAMAPRAELGVTPFSFISTRMNGDIKTQPGIAIIGEDNGARILMSGASSTESEMLFIAGDDPGRTIMLDANSQGAIVQVSDPKDTPTYPDVTISGDATGAGVLLADPRPSPIFGEIKIWSDDNGSTVALADPRPSPSVPDMLLVSNQQGAELAFGEVGGLGLIENVIMDFNAVPTGGNISLISPNYSAEIGLGADDITGTSFFVRKGGAVAAVDPKDQGVNLTLEMNANTLVDLGTSTTDGSLELSQANSQAKMTLNPSGITILDSEGGVTAVFEPNGVTTGKGNFGSGNTNAGTYSLVSGQGNSAGGNFSAVLGGSGNSASGGSAAIAGGAGNSATFGGAFIGGGQNNSADGLNSMIGGGNGNTAGGSNAVVPGGAANIADGDYSFAAGLRAHADHDGSLVWADASGAILSSAATNQFIARASGGTYFYSNSTSTTGVRLLPGSSTWSNLSDRNAKRNIRQVDCSEILEKLSRLDISQWSYKGQDESIEHIGPMAQDFYALFGLGEDNKHISTLDPSGVALSAIKALMDRIEVLENRISELEKIEK